MDSAPVILGVAGLLAGLGILGMWSGASSMRRTPFGYPMCDLSVFAIGLIVTLLGAAMAAQTLATLR